MNKTVLTLIILFFIPIRVWSLEEKTTAPNSTTAPKATKTQTDFSKLPPPKKFDKKMFEIIAEYEDPHAKPFYIHASLFEKNSTKYSRNYEAEIIDRAFPINRPLTLPVMALMPLAIELDQGMNIFEESWQVKGQNQNCLGMAKLTVRIDNKRKSFKLCPNDPTLDDNGLRVMNWMAYLKSISNEFVAPRFGQ